MHDRSDGAPSALDAWLENATQGLSNEARERIRVEISDHYESALEAATARGDSAHAARLSAIRSLGDPAEARRSFRRTNLTRFQEALVRDHRGRPSRGVLMLHLTLLALGLGAVAGFPESATQETVGAVSVGLMVAAIAVIHVLAPRAYGRGRVKTAVMAGAVAHWLLYCALCVGVPRSTGGVTWPYAAAFYTAILAVLLGLYLPLLGKAWRLDSRKSSAP